MPYLEQGVRASLEDGRLPMTAGELNYTITKVIDSYIVRKGLSYTNINEVIGALECAKLEAYRCVAAPYEDHKAKQNGEVYVAGR